MPEGWLDYLDCYKVGRGLGSADKEEVAKVVPSELDIGWAFVSQDVNYYSYISSLLH